MGKWVPIVILILLACVHIHAADLWAQSDRTVVIKPKPILNRSAPASDDRASKEESEKAQEVSVGLIPKRIIVEKIKNEGKITFESSVVNFDYGSDKIRPECLPQLNEIARALKDKELKDIELFYVDGHTCDIGTDSSNCQLSWRRSRSVMKVLVDVAGIDAKRLKARGFGESEPAHPNDIEENRAKNRRVVLKAAHNGSEDNQLKQCKDDK